MNPAIIFYHAAKACTYLLCGYDATVTLCGGLHELCEASWDQVLHEADVPEQVLVLQAS